LNNNASSRKYNSEVNLNTFSNFNSTKSEFKNIGVYKFKELLNQKDIKISELEKQIRIYKEKLKNQIRIFNINTFINSFNFNKAQSSPNVTKRNIMHIHSLSNSHEKIKSSFPISNNLYGNTNFLNFTKNSVKNKKRPNSNNYRKPVINNYFFGNNDNKKHVNNFKRFNNTKMLNNNNNSKIKGNMYMKNKRAKSLNADKYKSNDTRSSKNKEKDSEKKLLTIDETKMLCDRIYKKMKTVLELVKIATACG
jgi:hypothetical protein